VLGERYYVILVPDMEDHGEVDYDAKIISINKDAEPEARERTLLHETIHAGLFESGHNVMWDEEKEEPIVRALEHALWRAGYRRLGPS
jgi:Zn-dependent peptidase ImmA (M78 family)